MAVNTSFGRLWPHCDAKGHLVTVRAPVSGARFPVHAGIAPLVAEGLRRMERGIGGPAYLCDPPQCGANNCRKIAGTNSPSNHSGALAFDLNWRQNPFKKGARYTMPEWVWKMWEWLGFYWGGRYHDYMHIEYLKTPAMARARMLELGLLGGGPQPPPPPPPSGGGAPGFPLPDGYYYGPLDGPRGSISGQHRNDRPEWREGLSRWQSRMKERGWKIGADGQYGPQTKEVARQFQAEKRLGVDGLIGPGTWAAAWTAPVS